MHIQDDDHPILFLPGPVEVDLELRAIMAMPAIGHRAPAVKDATIRACEGLKSFYRTEQHAFWETGAGTLLMEAGVRNLIAAYDDLLSRPLRRREGGRGGLLARFRRG